MIKDLNVPSDLLVLNFKPKELEEKNLLKLIYETTFWKGYDARFGQFLLVQASDIDVFLSDKLPTMEECGYNNVKAIEKIPMDSKKWDDEKFFI